MTVFVLIQEHQNEQSYVDTSIAGAFHDEHVAREQEPIERRQAREQGLVVEDDDSPDGEWQGPGRSRNTPSADLSLESLLPALARIVEHNRARIESVRVVLASCPPKRRVVLRMPRVCDGLQELRVAVDTTAVLRRAPPRAANASWVAQRVVGRFHPLVHDHVLPVVAEIVGVVRRRRVPRSTIVKAR